MIATAQSQNPIVARRELGASLRRLRRAAGMTVEEVAGHLLCSPTKVSRIETGQRAASLRDVRDLCNLFDVGADEREHLMDLARAVRERSWWQGFELPYSEYVGLEAEAVSIREFRSTAVPGLLQTADYARAQVEAGMPPDAAMTRFPPDLVDRRVEARLTRQRLLTQDDPPRFSAVLDEAVLHRSVGGCEVIGRQLERIVEMADLPAVTVRVIPYDGGAHPALDSTFIILEFARTDVSDIVYVEGLVGNIYRDRPQDLDRYRQAFSRLSDAALSPADSTDLIARIRTAHLRRA